MSFTEWIAEPESQVLIVGVVMILIGAVIVLYAAFPVERIEEEPDPVDLRWDSYPRPRYEWVEWSETVRDAEALTEVLEAFVTDTVEFQPVDPLATTTEIERIDPSVPVYFSIRRPPPFRLESFTQGWTTTQIAEILEKHDANS